jgi:hypothetical protein
LLGGRNCFSASWVFPPLPTCPSSSSPLTILLTGLPFCHHCLGFSNRTVCGPEVQYWPINLPRHSHNPIKLCFRVIVL